jgi:response regulator NasT
MFMEGERVERLRLLITDEDQHTIDALAEVAVAIGHEPIARLTDPAEVLATVFEEDPDVALVGLGSDPGHALEHIASLSEQSSCPVIAVLDNPGESFVAEAADRGIFAIAPQSRPDELSAAIEVAHQRFSDYSNLRNAFGRRAIVERAKGVLMERHGIGEREAFERLRQEARSSNRKLAAVAQGALDARRVI